MLRFRHLRYSPFAFALASLLLLPGCDESDREENSADSSSAAGRPSEFVHPRDLEEGEDGLTRRKGETEPFSGAVIVRDQDWNLRYFAHYQKGKLHGPELKFWDDGTLRRNFDYEAGSKVRHREYFENGNPKIDATMVDGEAYGRHRTWFEDGTLRWTGRFVENLLWDGPVVDLNEDREVMWDAVFDRGKFVKGIYPEEAQERLLEEGVITPEQALYPIEGSSPTPTKTPGSDSDPEGETKP